MINPNSTNDRTLEISKNFSGNRTNERLAMQGNRGDIRSHNKAENDGGAMQRSNRCEGAAHDRERRTDGRTGTAQE
jgi:hypothetical protein